MTFERGNYFAFVELALKICPCFLNGDLCVEKKKI